MAPVRANYFIHDYTTSLPELRNKETLPLLGKSFVSRALQNSELEFHSALKKVFSDEKILHG